MKAQPLIAVRNVERSSRWYQQLLDCQSGHGGHPSMSRSLGTGRSSSNFTRGMHTDIRTCATRKQHPTVSACSSGFSGYAIPMATW